MSYMQLLEIHLHILHMIYVYNDMMYLEWQVVCIGHSMLLYRAYHEVPPPPSTSVHKHRRHDRTESKTVK